MQGRTASSVRSAAWPSPRTPAVASRTCWWRRTFGWRCGGSRRSSPNRTAVLRSAPTTSSTSTSSSRHRTGSTSSAPPSIELPKPDRRSACHWRLQPVYMSDQMTLDANLSSYDIEEASDRLARVAHELRSVIVGQDRVLERVLVALLAEGHVLLEGVPGLGKTLIVSTLARTLGGSFQRIQFTPDLLPSDVVGTRIYRPSSERFDVELGPVFANFLLADEINRAPAKVQSALLEVMAERQVTIAGITHAVPRPFLVLATQNPIESEGVYPLPEAQRDRFLMRVPVDYPTADQEHEIVRRDGEGIVEPAKVLELDAVRGLAALAGSVYVDPLVADYAVRLVLATRH